MFLHKNTGLIEKLIDENVILEKTIQDNRARIQEIATDLLKNDKSYAPYFYWQLPDVEVATITAIVKRIPPLESDYICSCGNKITFKTRAELTIFETLDKTKRSCNACKKSKIADAKQKATSESEKKAQRLKDLATMPYADYLKTPEWDKIRLRALKRVKYRCQVCNKKSVLNVHHRTYERRGHEKAADLIVLCKDCHRLYHFPKI
jgi:hypothetical protein